MNTFAQQIPICSVTTSQPVVALTLDDGPHETKTNRMLEIFERERVKVTFFEIGEKVSKYPSIARAIIGAGHEIGNHSRSHCNFGQIEEMETIRAEISTTQTIVREATGFTPSVFRAPFLSHSPALWSVLEELSLPSIGGTLAADWESTVTEENIIKSFSNAGPGDILLLHTWPVRTMEALPGLIRHLHSKGLKFVTVSELLATH